MIVLPSWALGALAFLKKNIVPVLIVVAMLFTHTWAYMKGRAHVEENFAQARAEQAEREIKLAKELEEINTKKAEETTIKVTQSQARRVRDREKADEYIQSNPLPNNCLLSDDDARMLNSLGDEDSTE